MLPRKHRYFLIETELLLLHQRSREKLPNIPLEVSSTLQESVDRPQSLYKPLWSHSEVHGYYTDKYSCDGQASSYAHLVPPQHLDTR
jgi:hypothetical protein